MTNHDDLFEKLFSQQITKQSTDETIEWPPDDPIVFFPINEAAIERNLEKFHILEEKFPKHLFRKKLKEHWIPQRFIENRWKSLVSHFPLKLVHKDLHPSNPALGGRNLHSPRIHLIYLSRDFQVYFFSVHVYQESLGCYAEEPVLYAPTVTDVITETFKHHFSQEHRDIIYSKHGRADKTKDPRFLREGKNLLLDETPGDVIMDRACDLSKLVPGWAIQRRLADRVPPFILNQYDPLRDITPQYSAPKMLTFGEKKERNRKRNQSNYDSDGSDDELPNYDEKFNAIENFLKTKSPALDRDRISKISHQLSPDGLRVLRQVGEQLKEIEKHSTPVTKYKALPSVPSFSGRHKQKFLKDSTSFKNIKKEEESSDEEDSNGIRFLFSSKYKKKEKKVLVSDNDSDQEENNEEEEEGDDPLDVVNWDEEEVDTDIESLSIGRKHEGRKRIRRN